MTIWDNIYKNFEKHGTTWATLKDELHPSFLEFINTHSFSEKKALDIGCGEGKYLHLLQELGFEITGIDSSETAIQMTKNRTQNKGEYICANMYKYDLPENTYSLVISHATLHHGLKTQVIALLDNIHKSLETDGYIFTSIPSDECLIHWPMMKNHDTLKDGTYIPTVGPEKGLAHSFFTKQEILDIFSEKYKNLSIIKDDRLRWIIIGQK